MGRSVCEGWNVEERDGGIVGGFGYVDGFLGDG